MSFTFGKSRENYRLDITPAGTLVSDAQTGTAVTVPFGQGMDFGGVTKYSKDTAYLIHHVRSHLEAYEGPELLAEMPVDFIRTGGAWAAGREGYDFPDRPDKVVVAYINATEFSAIGGWDPSFSLAWDADGDARIDAGVAGLPAYVDINVFNAAWKNYVAVYWSEAWKEQLRQKIDIMMSQNFDGIMLDVMDNSRLWVQAYPDVSQHELQLRSAELIRWISGYVKEKYGTAALVTGNLDREFHTFFPDLGNYVDGGYYQNAYFDWDGSGVVPPYAMTSAVQGSFSHPAIDFLRQQGLAVLNMDHLGTGKVSPGLEFINYNDRITDQNFRGLLDWAVSSGSTPFLSPVFFGTPYAQAPHFVRLYEDRPAYTSTSYADWVIGSAAGDRVTLGAGDLFHGGAGIDTAVLPSAAASQRVARTGEELIITDSASGARMHLIEVERIAFADGNVAFDMTGAAGKTAKLLGAIFGPGSVHNELYVGIGLSVFDAGWSDMDVVRLALDARLGNAAGSNEALVNLLYSNLVGASPPTDTLQYYSGQLASGSVSAASLTLMAAELPLNLANIGWDMLVGVGLPFTPA